MSSGGLSLSQRRDHGVERRIVETRAVDDRVDRGAMRRGCHAQQDEHRRGARAVAVERDDGRRADLRVVAVARADLVERRAAAGAGAGKRTAVISSSSSSAVSFGPRKNLAAAIERVPRCERTSIAAPSATAAAGSSAQAAANASEPPTVPRWRVAR